VSSLSLEPVQSPPESLVGNLFCIPVPVEQELSFCIKVSVFLSLKVTPFLLQIDDALSDDPFLAG
jgi:hypothetical protein